MPTVINPIYRVRLVVGNTERVTHAIWGAATAYDCQRESEEMFFRTKLVGNIVFVGADADWIVAKAFDTEFGTVIDRSDDLGDTWTEEWTGRFYMTDCEISLDDRRVTVQPTLVDQYTKVLDGMDSEYNLVELLPEIQPVRIKKHPMVQIYFSGDPMVTCIANGLAWEQDVSATTDYDVLRDEYHFYVENLQTVINAKLDGVSYETYEGTFGDPNEHGYYEGTFDSQGSTFLWIRHYYTPGGTAGGTPYPSSTQVLFSIRRYADDVEIYGLSYEWIGDSEDAIDPHNCEVTLEPAAGSSGTMKLEIMTQQICSRIMCDVDEIDGTETAPVSEDDFTYSRNYRRVIGYVLGSRYLITSNATSQTPTEYGKKNDSEYWAKPSSQDPIYPVGRNVWALSSIWFVNDGNILGYLRNVATGTLTLKTAYPLSSVLSVLLAKIDANITHQASTTYSQFLYAATNPVSGDQAVQLMVTPKSNILTGDFSQPATNAPVTLKNVLTMLRQVYQCYWHIDADNHFIVEHVSYYRNGGSYSTAPSVGTDLTTMTNIRNGKAMAYGTSRYKFDKLRMPERYEFAWMDEVTLPFMGKPIEVVSPYVEKGKKETVNPERFTTDIDYVLLCSENISKDGFALMACRLSGTQLYIPDAVINGGTYPWVPYTLTMQNGLLAYAYLQPKYWLSNMPARSLIVNEVATQATGVKRTKQQEVTMPCYGSPDPLALVKTFLGNGYVEQMNINLSSRTSKTQLVYEP